MNLTIAERRNILLIGDSITQQSFSTIKNGWGASLSDWYCRYADVTNRGFSGYNSRWLKRMMNGLYPIDKESNKGNKYMLATIFLGANDANSQVEQHVPSDEYKFNISSIVDHLRILNNEIVIILITPANVNNNLWKTRHNDNVQKYANSIRELGIEKDCTVLDLWKDGDGDCKMNDNTDLSDGLHLSKSGNDKIFFGIQEKIRKHHCHICPDVNEEGESNLKMHYPHWSILGSKSAEEMNSIIDNFKW
jgi:lysophospholipase L1-like esterase